MVAKITGKATGSIDVKRFYLEGLKLKDKCPSCKEEEIIDFSSDYLSYPSVNTVEYFTCYCNSCNTEWDIPLILEVKLKINKEK